jgi:hypothetical protein
MRRVVLSALIVVLAASAARSVEPADLERRMAAIRHTSEALRWQEIPWLTNLSEGMRLAKAEKRPLLLWVAEDDPLERC